MTYTPGIDPDRSDDPRATPLFRWLANLMGLHVMCSRAKCQRAQWCRGEPRKCLARYAPLVPEDAREGVKAMYDGRLRDLTLDEVRAEFPEVDDLLAWQELVTACAARGR